MADVKVTAPRRHALEALEQAGGAGRVAKATDAATGEVNWLVAEWLAHEGMAARDGEDLVLTGEGRELLEQLRATPLLEEANGHGSAVTSARVDQPETGRGREWQVPVSKLKPGPNVRVDLGDVEGLAGSIRELGVIEPLVVRPGPGPDGCWTVVAGHRRLAAAKLAGLVWVPAVVRHGDDADRVATQAAENLSRRGLSALEEAEAFRALADDEGWSQRRIGDHVGRSQAHVSRMLSLLDLPEAAKDELAAGDITIEDAIALARLSAHPDKVVEILASPSKQKGHQSVPSMVQTTLGALERQIKVDEAYARLSGQGVRVVNADPVAWPLQALRDLGRDGKLLGDGWDQVDVPVDEHAKLACHAAVVVESGDVTWVCTAATSHDQKPKPPRSPGESPESRERAAEREALDAAQHARIDHVRTLLTTKSAPLADVVAHALPHLLDVADAHTIGALLGIDDLDEDDADAELTAFAARGEAEMVRVLVALTVDIAEYGLGAYSHPSTWQVPAKRAYLDWLTDTGYQPSAVELARLEPADDPVSESA